MTSGAVDHGSPPAAATHSTHSLALALAALAAATDRQSLLAALLPCMVELPADTCVVSARSTGGDLETVGVVARGGAISAGESSVRLSPALQPSVQAAASHEPFVSEDVANDTRLDEPSRRIVLDQLQLGSLVTFPLIHEHKLLGSLAVGFRDRHAFPPEELRSVHAVALIVAAALAHIADRQVLARKVQEVHGLYRAGEVLAELGEEDVLLQRAAELLVSEIRYLSCWIAMVLPGNHALRGVAGAGGSSGSSWDIPLDDRSQTVVDAYHRGKPSVYLDIQQRAEREGWGEVARTVGFRCSVAVPLRAAGQMLGVLCVGSAAPNAGDDEVSLLAAFGNQLAAAVVRVRMNREREQQVATLQLAYERQAKLLDVVRDLSTPVIPVHDGVLVLPLVGTIDSTRSAQIMDSLLRAVQRENASMVIVDVTGVPMVDSAVANHLLQAIRAASLLGADCVLVGISPGVAQTMVQLGIDLSGVATRGNLQAGIAYALQRLRLEIRPASAVERTEPARRTRLTSPR